jgi:hypothetical protein
MHRVAFGDVYRLVILIGGKENLAIARTLDDARELALLEYEAEMPVGGLHEGAVDEQVAYDVATQHLLWVRGEAKLLPDAAIGERAVRILLEEVDECVEHHALGHAQMRLLG